MTSWLLMIVIALATFFFADSIVTPLILLLGKKFWVWGLTLKALMTKKNLLQAMVQSLVLTANALLRLVNKTITAWILPLLMTRRQRYWLHHALLALRRWVRMRLLRGWARWRRQPRWIRLATLIPAILLTLALFVASGFLLAGFFGVAFVVPWLGGLPLATVVFLRRQFARAALYVFERMGLGPIVNKGVDRAINLIWWQTPEPIQHRFDAWWRRFKIRLRRWVIGPRRKVVSRMARLRLERSLLKKTSSPSPSDHAQNAGPRSKEARSPSPYI